MLCPSVFRPSSLNVSDMAMRPLLDLHWPVRSLWPETRPLFYQVEREMIHHMQEMRRNIEYMERLHQKIFEEIDQSASSSSSAFKPIAFQVGQDDATFALTLDTKDFTPEELSVKQVGRKLRVSGKTERRQEDGKGSYSYRRQEFRQEFDVPEGVDPEAIACSLSGSQLQIRAPRERVSDGKERVVPISFTPAIASPPSESPGTEASQASAETEAKAD